MAGRGKFRFQSTRGSRYGRPVFGDSYVRLTETEEPLGRVVRGEDGRWTAYPFSQLQGASPVPLEIRPKKRSEAAEMLLDYSLTQVKPV